jgi:hypothetical protein
MNYLWLSIFQYDKSASGRGVLEKAFDKTARSGRIVWAQAGAGTKVLQRKPARFSGF